MTRKFLQGLVILNAVCAFGQGQMTNQKITVPETKQATNAPIVLPAFRYPPFDARFPHPLSAQPKTWAIAPESQR